MKKRRILVADDLSECCEGVRQALDSARFDVDMATSLEQARNLWDERHHDVVISDLCMPEGAEGLDLLAHVKARSPRTAVIIMTVHGEIDAAVKAIKLGAFDFLSKPITAEEIEMKTIRALDNANLVAANRCMRQEMADEYALIGDSLAIRELKRQIAFVALSDSRVLITGAHGTGKELVARAIQKASDRADKPFVRVNCAAIAETLIESELFGSEKGSFTGSIDRRPGKFELADGGTIFLDEIGDMSPAVQAKVLRVLEAGEIDTVGGLKALTVDVRVIAATNKNLREKIAAREFREDLYFRLAAATIGTTPLKDRKEDIPQLVELFMNRLGRRSSLPEMIDKRAIEYLQAWPWPGNVRELKSVVERVLIYNTGARITVDDLRCILTANTAAPGPVPMDTSRTLKDARADFERDYISRVLKETKTIAEAAERLDISRPHLHQKMKELGIAN